MSEGFSKPGLIMTDFTSLLSHTNRWTDSEIVKKGKVEGHRDKKDSIPGDILYTTTKSVWTPMTTYVLKSLVWEQAEILSCFNMAVPLCTKRGLCRNGFLH